MVKYLLAIVLVLQGCAAIPKWSEEPQNCNPDMWGPEYDHDVWNYAKASGRVFTKTMPYICVEYPEVVRLPAYIELLKVPPAENMYSTVVGTPYSSIVVPVPHPLAENKA